MNIPKLALNFAFTIALIACSNGNLERSRKVAYTWGWDSSIDKHRDEHIKYGRKKFRLACNPENLLKQLNRVNLSFDFIDVELYMRAEEKLDPLMAAGFLKPALWNKIKSVDARIENMETGKDTRAKDTDLVAWREVRNRYEYVTNPPNKVELVKQYQDLSLAWMQGSITKLKESPNIWSDYIGLRKIYVGYLNQYGRSCAGWVPDRKDDDFKKLNKIGLKNFNNLEKEIENKMYSILLDNFPILKKEIESLLSESDHRKFFFTYVSGYEVSYRAMDRVGLFEVYRQRYQDITGKPGLPKFRN